MPRLYTGKTRCPDGLVNSTPDETSKKAPPEAPDTADVARWITLAQGGDEDAFGELVQAFSSRVYAVVYRMVNNEQDAKEQAQLAWVKAWQRLGSFQSDAQFFTWLYRIAVNTTLDHLRQRARSREVSVDAVPEGEEPRETEWPSATEDTPAHELARSEFRAAFDRALQDLSPEHRAALVLREVEGQSYQEIAAALGCRVGTVMSRLFYARRQLQEKLKDILP